MSLPEVQPNFDKIPTAPFVGANVLALIDDTFFFKDRDSPVLHGNSQAQELRAIFAELAERNEQPFQDASASLVRPLWVPGHPRPLSLRDAHIFELVRGLREEHPRSMAAVGRGYGITRTRVRDIKFRSESMLRHPDRITRLLDSVTVIYDRDGTWR